MDSPYKKLSRFGFFLGHPEYFEGQLNLILSNLIVKLRESQLKSVMSG